MDQVTHLRIWTASRQEGKSLCGKFWLRQENERDRRIRHTVEKSQVTCLKCLQLIGLLGGQDYWKSGGPGWVVVDTASAAIQYYAPSVTIEQVRFDEGASAHVIIRNVPQVRISSTAHNVLGGIAGTTGILLDNVASALITHPAAGWSPYPRPFITAINGSRVKVVGRRLAPPVYLGDADPTSSITEE